MDPDMLRDVANADAIEQQRLDALLEHRKQFRASLSPSQSEIAREITVMAAHCQCDAPRQQARNSGWICAICGRPIIQTL